VLLVLAASCQSFSGYAFLGWAPTFLVRVHDMGAVEIGWTLGLVVGIGGSVGAWFGGVAADRLAARDARAPMWISAVVSLVGVPFAAGFLLLPTRTAALACFVPFYAIGAMYVGPLWAMGQNLAQPHMRATASALLLLILNIVGLGAGPFVVGAANDLLAARFGEEAIRWSLLLAAGVGGLAAPLFAAGARTYRQDLAAAQRA
jgi:predicted MFS family arabinose efflux permease